MNTITFIEGAYIQKKATRKCGLIEYTYLAAFF